MPRNRPIILRRFSEIVRSCAYNLPIIYRFFSLIYRFTSASRCESVSYESISQGWNCPLIVKRFSVYPEKQSNAGQL